MIRHLAIDDATMRGLERHETLAHAIPAREVRDLGDSLVLHDPRDPDPFWNRMVSVRWPEDEAGFDRRFSEALALFASLARRPHIWPSPVHSRPADLAERLFDHGFRDEGGGHLLVLEEPSACPPLHPAEPGLGVTIHAIREPADAAPGDPDDVALVLAESFGAMPGRAADLAADLRRSLADPRIVVVLVRVGGEPASAAKATSFDGLTYLSSIATRDAFRGRGLAGLATRHALAVSGGGTRGGAYLGVHSANLPALRLYARLGFASIGDSADLVLG